MEIQYSTVFRKFRNGYHNFRIPAIITSEQGNLITFAEARKFRGDQTRNDIVLKRSIDSGKTWGPMIIVASMGKDSLNNPVPVVIRDSGRIILMFQKYPFPARAGDVVAGWEDPGELKLIRKKYRSLRVVKTYITYSDDDGLTWVSPKDITQQIKRPQEATTLSSGPGSGIQLSLGKYKDRILIPFNEGPRKAWKVFAAISDDGGDTWTTGNRIPDANITGCGNENQMVELTDGTILCNARNQGEDKNRLVATSNDGGQTWTEFRIEPQLPDPQCQGSIIRFTPPPGNSKSRLLFSNPASQSKRYNGTVYLSYDEGRTWPTSRCIYPKRRKFAYSCLVALPDYSIGCIFEADSFYAAKKLIFVRFDLDWLTEGKDQLKGE